MLLLGYLLASYHRSFKDGIAVPREKSTELVFDLLPTSIIFKAGYRIQVITMCADKNNYLTVELSPKPVVNIFRSSDPSSYIALPIIPASLK